MRIAIYSPYLDTFGGGERYMMTIAQVLSFGNGIEVLLDQHLNSFNGDYLKRELSKRFNLNLTKVNFINAPVGRGSNAVERLFFIKKYDVLIYLTDGSIFFPTAKKNILHVQSPLAGETNSLWKKIKLRGWDLIIYNSRFTKAHSENNWPIKSKIIYPPVDITKIKPLTKKKYILSVGRFFGHLKDKKHSLIIKVFQSLINDNQLNGWSLHLAGAASEGDKEYLRELTALAKGFSISFYPNIEYGELVRLYGESSIYWHAAGFGEDDPTKMEHFGISTVEAMSGGCVPIVVNKGGLTEIVNNSENGFLWNSLKDLEKITVSLIKEQDLRTKLSRKARVTSQKFSKEIFETEIKKLIDI